MPALLSHSMPTSLFLVCTPAIVLSLSSLVSYSKTVIALLSHLMLDPTPTHLISSAHGTFKQALSDESLYHHSTSQAKRLCPFLILGPLSEKSERKRLFDMVFINSRPLASNHTIKEICLSFGEYRCPSSVKLNRL